MPHQNPDTSTASPFGSRPVRALMAFQVSSTGKASGGAGSRVGGTASAHRCTGAGDSAA